jgi:hypothetical protein
VQAGFKLASVQNYIANSEMRAAEPVYAPGLFHDAQMIKAHFNALLPYSKHKVHVQLSTVQ